MSASIAISVNRATRACLACLSVLFASAAHASEPVVYRVTGCVINGAFVSETYKFKVMNGHSDTYEEVDLSHYEGQTIRIDGMLSPGDHIVGTLSVIARTCRPELHKGEFQ